MDKKFVRSVFTIAMLFILVGCGRTEISNDIRVLIKGEIIDEDNQPIPNAAIQVYTDANVSGAQRALLGEGLSDDLGNFSITSLFGANTLFYIDIFVDDNYSTYRYQTNTDEFIPNDLIFDLQTVELYQLSVFNYNIIRESGSDNTLEFSFRYIEPRCNVVYDEGVFNVSQSSCNEDRLIYNSLNNLVPNAENRELIVPFQSQIEFIYSINGEDSISEIINVNAIDYEFQFSY
jgi:hypothetical protein